MSMKGQFRARASQAVERAKAGLASGDDGRLVYAALELRLAMEAITYDRGAETVLNLATLKAHYDAIGSYLRMRSRGGEPS